MSNFDSIIYFVGGTGRNQINPLTLASTTETVFVIGTDTSGTTQTAILSIPGTGTNLVGSGSPAEFNQNAAISSQSYGRKATLGVGTEPPYFSATTFDSGRPFRVRISGTATLNAGTGNTVAVNLYIGTSATVGSNTKIAALTAGGAPSTTVQFLLETVVQWDSTTQTVSGWYQGNVNNSLTAAHALSNQASVTAASKLNFIPTAVFGASGGGVVSIAEMSIEQV